MSVIDYSQIQYTHELLCSVVGNPHCDTEYDEIRCRYEAIGKAYSLNVAHVQGNFVRFFRLVQGLPPLALSVLLLWVDSIRQ